MSQLHTLPPTTPTPYLTRYSEARDGGWAIVQSRPQGPSDVVILSPAKAARLADAILAKAAQEAA